MSESPREPAGAVLQIGDRCAAVPDANPRCSAHRWGEEEMCRASSSSSSFFLKERGVQREQLLCASAEEQGEIRALQEERGGGREGRGGGTHSKDPCIIKLSSGREAPKYDLELLPVLRLMI